MGVNLDPPIALLLAFGLLLLAIYAFARVRSDYRQKGKLTRWVSILQTGFFYVYAFSSYLFLDSRLTAVTSSGILLALAVLLMLVGLTVVLLSMPFLGKRSFGAQVGELHTSGIYRFSRNPQLVGSFVFIIGYVLLWPSWNGLIWAALWLPISHLMVRGEEEHLRSVFGEQYEQYCKITSRYIGFPKITTG
jgi:protein-S-isoprenylcysteine O-methyltransferase Ste14